MISTVLTMGRHFRLITEGEISVAEATQNTVVKVVIKTAAIKGGAAVGAKLGGVVAGPMGAGIGAILAAVVAAMYGSKLARRILSGSYVEAMKNLAEVIDQICTKIEKVSFETLRETQSFDSKLTMAARKSFLTWLWPTEKTVIKELTGKASKEMVGLLSSINDRCCEASSRSEKTAKKIKQLDRIDCMAGDHESYPAQIERLLSAMTKNLLLAEPFFLNKAEDIQDLIVSKLEPAKNNFIQEGKKLAA